jgi:hypothetical protein
LCHVGEDMSSLHLFKMGDKLHIISGSGRIAVHMAMERMSGASPHALDNVALREVVCIMCCAMCSSCTEGDLKISYLVGSVGC